MTNRRRFLQAASMLMGHAAFPQVLAAFLEGTSDAPTWLDPREIRLLEQLVDLILPATDSPAASAARTHVFIDLALAACGSDEQQRAFRAGLRDLIEQGFATADSERQVELLAQRAAADMPLPYDRSFFRILKDYTLTGYFHSEIGATQALAWERVPGGYEADVELEPGQKAWAL